MAYKSIEHYSFRKEGMAMGYEEAVDATNAVAAKKLEILRNQAASRLWLPELPLKSWTKMLIFGHFVILA
uniref:Uncharacterized protein n=1 Tax=Romanomermis culicivorax TaxID=13658 RepID=A0A915HSK0_ROMCU